MTSRSTKGKTAPRLKYEAPEPEARGSRSRPRSIIATGKGTKPPVKAMPIIPKSKMPKTVINNALSPDMSEEELSDASDIEIKTEPDDLIASEHEGRTLRTRKQPSSQNPDFVYYGAASSSFGNHPRDTDTTKAGMRNKAPTAKRQNEPSGSGLTITAKKSKFKDAHFLGGRRLELELKKTDIVPVIKALVSVPSSTSKRQNLPVPPIVKIKEEVPVENTRSHMSKVRNFVQPRIEFPEFDTDEDESILLEVCVDNFVSIVNAAKGGAKRIELCSSLSEGGLTPTPGLLKMAKANVKIPVFVMIRPRGGDFVYSFQEIEIMTMDIVHYKEIGADGFVFGVLDNKGSVDVAKCKILMKAADPLPCTFHRAFDMVIQPLKALESIMNLGFSRILTSGQQTSAETGIPFIRKLVQTAGNFISIMAGAGVNVGNVAKIVRETGVKEVHGSARVIVESQMKRKGKNGVSMGTPGTDDSSYYATDSKIVADIVKNASTAFKQRITTCDK